MLKPKETFIDRTIQFSLNIFQFVDTLPSKRAYWVITDQLVRSASSIGANIVEAKAASSKKDYINFYSYALKSANETTYWLTLIEKMPTSQSQLISPLLEESIQLAKVIAASIITMKKNSKLNL